jgi:hypothetical protein
MQQGDRALKGLLNFSLAGDGEMDRPYFLRAPGCMLMVFMRRCCGSQAEDDESREYDLRQHGGSPFPLMVGSFIYSPSHFSIEPFLHCKTSLSFNTPMRQ